VRPVAVAVAVTRAREVTLNDLQAGERRVRPSGPNGPAYRTTENFRVILRWNQSDFFGLAVGLLSDKIAAAR